MPPEVYLIFIFSGTCVFGVLVAFISNCMLTHRMKQLYSDIWGDMYGKFEPFLQTANTRIYFDFLNNYVCCGDKKIFLLKKIVWRAYRCFMISWIAAFFLAVIMGVRLVYFS